VAALKKEKKPFFIAKLHQEIDSDGTKMPSVAAAGTLAASPLAASTVTAATAATAATSLD
jgi:hypothetical protein